MEAKGISQAVIGRLPRYFRYLGELKDEGVERISSQELSAGNYPSGGLWCVRSVRVLG